MTKLIVAFPNLVKAPKIWPQKRKVIDDDTQMQGYTRVTRYGMLNDTSGRKLLT